MSVLLAWTTSLLAGNITREQADAIVLEYLKNEGTHFDLYVNSNTPNEEGLVITTPNGEIVKAKYACWVYCVTRYCIKCPSLIVVPPAPVRYLFVKEDNGSLLEVITSNDSGLDLSSWETLDITGLTVQKENNKSPYPNPVDDWLTIPCGENAHVEIRDLKGTLLYSGLLSGKDARLNVSFLNVGIYMVNINGETHKIIKN